ncbi:MAG: tRNA (guanosine(37)-N1)-methyltransferase TrmD [Candidatus Levybacteria bacterium RIFCSPLOWO2_01_FULL_38_13]|nr:MAG: tRNA (guanosine(37)-N1)-methyltransferase TrmD [Candidatus Levybacteria bacterium RIFCSPHIGHO2_01_FULL_41_15]OGH35263.1 MAG: tRNA (guanosine(37)-N1)-methyltransferase TrmD [Candidatus Levybacteria bacterium RIFCSPLOWO2_01_FULL_38_13]
MTISILTLFPEMFEGPFDHSIIKNAVNKGLVKINYINIRDFGIGRHKTVDDKPYGGGKGMILRVDVLEKAIENTKKSFKEKGREKVILFDPAGKKYHQKTAYRLSSLEHLILVCGHYEGFDARIKEFIDEEISLGDFILTGGEIPAIAVVDSVVRLIKGVLHDNVTDEESFSRKEQGGLLEYFQYTRPAEYKKLKVPQVLLSGNHEKIRKWKERNARRITILKRPDLLKSKKAS